MLFGKIAGAVAFILCAGLTFAKPAEEYFRLCRRSEADFESCIKQSLAKVKPILMEGISDIDLPPMEPYALSRFDFKENNQNFKFVASLSNMEMKGLADATVKEVTFEENEDSSLTLNITFKTPNLHMYGKYMVNGRILLLRLEGKGHMDVNFTETTIKLSIRGTPVTNPKDGEEYLQIDSTKVKLNIKKGGIVLYNLFNGDKTLGRIANNFINQNFMTIVNALIHFPERWYAENFERNAQIIFDHWPLNQLLPQ